MVLAWMSRATTKGNAMTVMGLSRLLGGVLGWGDGVGKQNASDAS